MCKARRLYRGRAENWVLCGGYTMVPLFARDHRTPLGGGQCPTEKAFFRQVLGLLFLGCAQGLLITLHSGISVPGPYGMPVITPGLALCKAMPAPMCYHSWPQVLGFSKGSGCLECGAWLGCLVCQSLVWVPTTFRAAIT